MNAATPELLARQDTNKSYRGEKAAGVCVCETQRSLITACPCSSFLTLSTSFSLSRPHFLSLYFCFLLPFSSFAFFPPPYPHFQYSPIPIFLFSNLLIYVSGSYLFLICLHFISSTFCQLFTISLPHFSHLLFSFSLPS